MDCARNPDVVARTNASPGVPAVARPLLEIASTFGGYDSHWTGVVASWIYPSLITALATNCPVSFGAMLDGPLILSEAIVTCGVVGPGGLGDGELDGTVGPPQEITRKTTSDVARAIAGRIPP